MNLYGSPQWQQLIAGFATKAGNLSQFAATTSAELRGVISDETGTGALVFATSPTITTPTIAQIDNTAGVIIAGTNTNDSAAAGKIGEYKETIVASGSAVALTTATQTNMTTGFSLTAGDWDVSLTVYFQLGATTSITRLLASISQTSATLNLVAGFFSDWEQAAAVPGGNQISATVAAQRFSLAGTTTIYPVVFAAFTVSTCAVWGKISARRMR